MRRDTLAYAIAGIVFGFVAGYMTANWSAMPRPAPVAAASGGGASAPARPDARELDANEVRAMESLAARQPNDPSVRVELGNLYMDHERWDEAARWYREALALVPDNPDVATDLGACLVHGGRPAEGLAHFEKVLAENPDHVNARFNKGVALMALGRSGEAADTWEDLLRRHPDDGRLARLRARVAELRASASRSAPAAGTP